MAIESIIIEYMVMIGGCLIAFAFGNYLYMMASSKCVKQTIFDVIRCTGGARTNRQILERFIEYVDTYTTVKQLSIHDFKMFLAKQNMTHF